MLCNGRLRCADRRFGDPLLDCRRFHLRDGNGLVLDVTPNSFQFGLSQLQLRFGPVQFGECPLRTSSGFVNFCAV